MTRNHLVLLALVLSASRLFSQTARPLWEVDLTKFGYQGRPPSALAHVSPTSAYKFSWTYQQGVVFIHSSIAVAYFVVRDAPPEVRETQEPSTLDPFRLVAIFMDVRNGAIVKQLDWPLPRKPNQVSHSFFYPVGEGRFVVILGNQVELYSSDFKLLGRFDSPGEMSPVASVSGGSLLLQTYMGKRFNTNFSTQRSCFSSSRGANPFVDLPHKIDSLWGDRLAWTMRSTLYLGSAASESVKLLAARPTFCDEMNAPGSAGLIGPGISEPG